MQCFYIYFGLICLNITVATIQLPTDSVALDATVTDDGLPSNTLTYSWSVLSGPGGATFADASAVDTTVTFASAGTYVLQLTASDSALQGSDTLQVTVQPAAVVRLKFKSNSLDPRSLVSTAAPGRLSTRREIYSVIPFSSR